MRIGKRYWNWAIIGLVAMSGCGGHVDDEAIGVTEAEAKPVSFPAYIVYLQPTPGINPLFTDVQAFILTHDTGANEAAAFPPHLTLTGFFDTSLSQLALINRFERAIDSVGTPFGQPLIMPKQGAASAVQCNPGTKLVTLHVRLTNDYQRLRSELVKIPGAQGHVKTTSHITLFQAVDPKAISKTVFDRICADARAFFVPRIPFYDSTADGFARWQVALFRAPHAPTPSNPLRQSDAIDVRQVNP